MSLNQSDKNIMEDEVDKFLNEVANDPFKQDTVDPFDAVAEKTETEPKEEPKEEAAAEKPLPFHKDPKVQRYIEKEIAKKLGDIKPEATKQEVKDEIEEVLVRLIGNDTPEKVAAVRDFKRVLSGIEEKGAERAISRLREQEEEAARIEAEQEAAAVEAIDEGFENIESSYNIDLSSNTAQAKKLRSEFIDFVKKVSPKDEDGEPTALPDLVETFGLFQQMNKAGKPVNSKAKEIASRSLARSTDASNAPQTEGKSWRDVDRIFSKLAN